MSSNNIPKSIDIKIKATHFDFVNKNYLLYTKDAVRNGAKSWTSPYSKPQLVAHDKSRDPIGRIIDYNIVEDSSEYPPNYVELTVNVPDKNAIEKILDGRYMTVSVGSKSSKVICSECDQVLTEDGLCEHKKGTFNEDGQPIYWIIDNLDYTEDSFVNEPADPYACISEININGKWIAYKDFLDDREDYLSGNINLEDHTMAKLNDAKLTSKARKNLPDSAFCYVVTKEGKKIRKFPAHDAAHVRNGLARLNQADIEDSAKKKVLACLKRKAKRFNIKVSEDSLNVETFEDWMNVEDSFGIDDEHSEEEVQSVIDFFEKNPDFDEIQSEDSTEENEDSTEENSDENQDTSKLKKDELISLVDSLKEKITAKEKEIESKDEKIESLKAELEDSKNISNEREDEVNLYLDKNAILQKKYKDSIISNVIDLKMTDNKNEDREALQEKFSNRSVQSLLDTLTDLREFKNNLQDDSEDSRIKNPTNNNDNNSEDNLERLNDEVDSKWDLFKQPR